MTTSNNIVPGITIEWQKKIYRVESTVKVSVAKGTPFIKMSLRDIMTDKITEKNFKLEQEVKEVTLAEHVLEYLYPEGKDYLFFDVDTLDKVKVSTAVLGDKVLFLKEGVPVKAMFYGDTVFSVELPQFLELMVVKTSDKEDKELAASVKEGLLETGAKVDVPLFIEVGDVIKVDVQTLEFIQRI